MDRFMKIYLCVMSVLTISAIAYIVFIDFIHTTVDNVGYDTPKKSFVENL